jgi:hypothetical protein
MPRAYLSNFFRWLSQIINQYSTVVARTDCDSMSICAERDTLQRGLSFYSFDDDLIVDIVEHNILVQTDWAKQKLVQRTERDTSDAWFMSDVKTGGLSLLVHIIKCHSSILLSCRKQILVERWELNLMYRLVVLPQNTDLRSIVSQGGRITSLACQVRCRKQRDEPFLVRTCK